MASKNIVITNGSASETTYNADKIEEKLATGRAITGNQTISGNLTVGGTATLGDDLSVTGDITGDSIVENMTGYSASLGGNALYTYENVYTSMCKNGNKLTIVCCVHLTKSSGAAFNPSLCVFTIPSAVGAKLYPFALLGNDLDSRTISCVDEDGNWENIGFSLAKTNNTTLSLSLSTSNMNLEKKTLLRYEATFLLNDNLISA